MEVNKNTTPSNISTNPHSTNSSEETTSNIAPATSPEVISSEEQMTDNPAPTTDSVTSSMPSLSTTSSSTSAETTSPASDSSVQSLIQKVLTSSKLDVAQAALKQASKLLQAIAKKNEKKSRQLRTDNIIIKKYIMSTPHVLDVMKAIGFEEATIDGKQYIQIAEDHANIAEMSSLADELANAVVVAPVPTTPSAPSAPVYCVNNCGFYGDPKRDNLCSKCYKLQMNKILTSSSTVASKQPAVSPSHCISPGCKNKPIPPQIPTSDAEPAVPASGRCILCEAAHKHKGEKRTPKQRARRALLKVRVVNLFNKSKRPVQTDKERCWTCNRKLHLSGVECRCGYVFCGKHRYADEHNCTFDHYKRHMASLAKQHQIVKNAKFEALSDD